MRKKCILMWINILLDTFGFVSFRLLAANPLRKQSAHILLERGLVQVEGGFVFSKDLRISVKDIVCISLQCSLEMQSKTQASVLVILAEQGTIEKTFTSILQHFQDTNVGSKLKYCSDIADCTV